VGRRRRLCEGEGPHPGVAVLGLLRRLLERSDAIFVVIEPPLQSPEPGFEPRQALIDPIDTTLDAIESPVVFSLPPFDPNETGFDALAQIEHGFEHVPNRDSFHRLSITSRGHRS
jgi:hypothetical protein